MDIQPSEWGSSYWKMLHFSAAGYPINPNASVQNTMKTFIQSIPVLLPCQNCKDHAFEYVKSSNLDKIVSSRMELFTFFFDFHNAVNKRLNKPLFSKEDAMKMFHYFPTDTSQEVAHQSQSFGVGFLFLICLVLLSFLIFKKK